MISGQLELVLDASDGGLVMVVHQAGQLLLAEDWRLTNAGCEVLAPALSQICRHLGTDVGSFGRAACVTGPGSFTGIRLILTTVQAFRRVHPLPLAALNGLELMALECLRRTPCDDGTRIVVASPARRNLVHAQFFRVEGGRLVPVSPISLLEPIRLAAQIERCDLLCGSATLRYSELFEGKVRQIITGFDRPSPETLMLAAQAADYADRDLEPLYVREVDALDNLERLAARQGLSGSDAKSRYDALLSAGPQSSI